VREIVDEALGTYELTSRMDALELAQSRDRERTYRSTVVGPHRDDIELKIDAFLFFVPRPRVKTVAEIIVLLIGEFLKRVRAHMMIGDGQAVGGYKRTAAARTESHARFLEMIEPLLGRLEVVFFLQLFRGRRVVEPHSLIAERAITQAGEQDAKAYGRQNFSHSAA